MLRQSNGSVPVLRCWGNETASPEGGGAPARCLRPDELRRLAGIIAGRNSLALGDLPPREGLTWLIQWGGRPWPSSCGGASTDLLFGYKGKSYLIRDGEIPEIDAPAGSTGSGERAGEPGNLHDLLEILMEPSGITENYQECAIFIPFTGITLEYLNLLFIYAGRGYPFRMVDSARDYRALPALNPPGDLPSGDFSLFDLEARVLTLLVVEQSFAMANLARAAAHSGLFWSALEIGTQEDLSLISGHILNSFEDIPVFSVPRYPSMSEAVDAFLEYKWRSRKGPLPYREPQKVLAEIPYPSKQKIQRVKDFCNAIFENHGRFPVHLQPFHFHLVMLAWGRG